MNCNVVITVASLLRQVSVFVLELDVIIGLAVADVQLAGAHHQHNHVLLVNERETHLMNGLVLDERAQLLRQLEVVLLLR